MATGSSGSSPGGDLVMVAQVSEDGQVDETAHLELFTRLRSARHEGHGDGGHDVNLNSLDLAVGRHSTGVSRRNLAKEVLK